MDRRQLIAGGLGVAGLGLVGWSFLGGESPPAPLPQKPFDTPAPASTVQGGTVAANPDDAAGSGSTSGEQQMADAPKVPMTPERMGPNRLFIPSIGTYATITNTDIENGSLVVPDKWWEVGKWTDGAPLFAKQGVTLLTGHVSFNGNPGAVSNLASIAAGDLIYLSNSTGKRETFVASSLKAYVKQELPRSVYATTGPRKVCIVTCGGPVTVANGRRFYRDNVVVFGDPVS